jgi:hypothetical protein
MKSPLKTVARILATVPFGCAALLASRTLPPQAAAPARIEYTTDGKMTLPDYRQWVFLSSGLGMSYTPPSGQNANPHFDNVFVNREAYQAFLRTGMWPDQTALILEIRASESKSSINKDGRVQTELGGIEAHVKDASRGGWAFYSFSPRTQLGTLIPKTENCYSCHEQSGAVNTTFVQFYPTLAEVAKNKGTFKSTDDGAPKP